MRLHFEDTYRGYFPAFDAPSVTISPVSVDFSPFSDFSIVQPIDDTADSTATGAPPASSVCHAEELDLGPLPDGYYGVDWWDQVTVRGTNPQVRLAGSWSFWWNKGSVQCFSFPRFLTSTAVGGAPFDIVRNQIALLGADHPTATVSGNVISVVQIIQPWEGPLPGLLPCEDYRVTIPPVPAGEYTVNWSFVSNSSPNLRSGNDSFNISVQDVKGRRRSARH